MKSRRRRPVGPRYFTEDVYDALDPAMHVVYAATFGAEHARMADDKPEGGGFAHEFARRNRFAQSPPYSTDSAIILSRVFLMVCDGKLLPAYLLARIAYTLSVRAQKAPKRESSGARPVVIGLVPICEATCNSLSRVRYAARTLAQRGLVKLERPKRAGYAQLTVTVNTKLLAHTLVGAQIKIDALREQVDSTEMYYEKVERIDDALAAPVKAGPLNPFIT